MGLKLRAWHKKHHKMYEVDEINFLTKKALITNADGMTFQGLDDLIFMQSSGLFDKNKIEIFEGDIVIWKMILTPYDHELNPSGFNQVIVKDGNFVLENTDGCPFEFLKDLDEIEIVGNIYENPELLERTK